MNIFRTLWIFFLLYCIGVNGYTGATEKTFEPIGWISLMYVFSFMVVLWSEKVEISSDQLDRAKTSNIIWKLCAVAACIGPVVWLVTNGI